MLTKSGQSAERRNLWVTTLMLVGLLASLIWLSGTAEPVTLPAAAVPGAAAPTAAQIEELYRQLDDLQRQSDDLGRRIREDIDALHLRQQMMERARAAGTDPSLVDYAWDQAAGYGVNPLVYVKQIDHESGWDAKALNVNRDLSVDRNLPQINSATWPWLAAALHLTDPWDPKQAIQAGAYYMAVLLRENGGSYDRALTAYNRGEAGLQTWLASRGTARSPYSQAIMAGTEG